MSDDVLTDDLVRYQILSKVTPGKIIVVNELGHWDIIEPSTFKSGMRSFWSLLTSQRFPPSQRSIFLTHLKETTNHLISHCDLQMQTHVFHICLKQLQAPTLQDIEKFDQIMNKLKTIAQTLCEGMKGLETLCKTTPYQNDVNFSGEVDIKLIYQIKCFFQRILNTVGITHAKAILGDGFKLVQSPIQATGAAMGVAAHVTTTSSSSSGSSSVITAASATPGATHSIRSAPMTSHETKSRDVDLGAPKAIPLPKPTATFESNARTLSVIGMSASPSIPPLPISKALLAANSGTTPSSLQNSSLHTQTMKKES